VAAESIQAPVPAPAADGRRAARRTELDALRLLCLFAIVMIHLVSGAWEDEPVASAAWRVLNVFDALSRFGVPVFVMISGALLLDPARAVTLRDLYLRRVPRLACAWVFWSLLYASRYLMVGRGAPVGETLRTFFDAFLSGEFHLWFIGMLIGLYMAAPFLRPAAADPKLRRYFLLLSALIASVLPSLAELFPALPFAGTLVDALYLYVPAGYSLYFMLGYALSAERPPLWARAAVYALGLLGALVTILGTEAALLRDPAFGSKLFWYLTPNVVCQSAAVFLFFTDVLSRVRWRTRAVKLLAALSDLGFGAFLCHEVFVILLPHLGLSVLTLPPLVMAPLLALGVLGASLAVSFVLNRIPGVRKYIV